MASLPEYVLRSYRGGCTYLTLTETVGAGTLSIPVTGTLTNWPTKTLAATTGPFVICLTRGTAKEEKVLCSSLAKNTGIITVWSTGTTTGRGYDTTSAHTHAPTSTVQQVVLVWTATEAREANRAANAILGAPTAHSTSATAKANETSMCSATLTLTLPAAPTDGTRNTVLCTGGVTTIKPGSGATITWGASGKSSVQIATGMGVTLAYENTVWYVVQTNGVAPGGRMHASAQTIVEHSNVVKVGSMAATSNLRGGVSLATDELKVPIAGWYEVNCSITYQNADGAPTPGNFRAMMYVNGAEVRTFGNGHLTTGQTFLPQVGGSDLLYLAATADVALYAFSSSTTNATDPRTTKTFLSLAWRCL